MINKKLLNPIQNKGATKTGILDASHDTLINRDKAEQHPISAISSLQDTLDNFVTLDTDQTINGKKLFEEGIFFEKIGAGANDTKIQDRLGNIEFYSRGTKVLSLSPGEVVFNSQRLLYVANPRNDKDAANKKYVDDLLDTVNVELGVNSINISQNADDILLKADKTELATKQDKLTAGTNISIVDNVISSTGGSGVPTNMMTTDTDQTITGIKSFDNGIKSNLIEVNGKDLIIKNSNTLASYVTVEQTYNGTGYKNWFGFVFVRNIEGTKNNLGALQVKNNENFWLTATNDLIINGVNIKFSNKTLQQVATPINDTDAATKKYVDDAIKAAIKPKP